MRVEHFEWEKFEGICIRKDEKNGRFYAKQSQPESLEKSADSLLKFLKSHHDIQGIEFNFLGVKMYVTHATTLDEVVTLMQKASEILEAAEEEMFHYMASHHDKNLPSYLIKRDYDQLEHVEWDEFHGLGLRTDEKSGKIVVRGVATNEVEREAKAAMLYLIEHPEIESIEFEHDLKRMTITQDTTLEEIMDVMDHQTIIFGELGNQIREFTNEYYSSHGKQKV